MGTFSTIRICAHLLHSEHRCGLDTAHQCCEDRADSDVKATPYTENFRQSSQMVAQHPLHSEMTRAWDAFQ